MNTDIQTIFQLPLLLHALFFMAGSGILAALAQNIVCSAFCKNARPTPPPTLRRTLTRICIFMLLASLMHQLFSALFFANTLSFQALSVEIALLALIALITFILHKTNPDPLRSSISLLREIKAILALIISIVLLWLGLVTIFTILFFGLDYGLGSLQILPKGDIFPLSVAGTLGLFFCALHSAAQNINAQQQHNATSDMPQNDKNSALRRILWPFLVALGLFMIPLMAEKYMLSEAYIRMQNPPQALQRV